MHRPFLKKMNIFIKLLNRILHYLTLVVDSSLSYTYTSPITDYLRIRTIMAIDYSFEIGVSDDILESGLPNSIILNIRLESIHVVHIHAVARHFPHRGCIRIMAFILAGFEGRSTYGSLAHSINLH